MTLSFRDASGTPFAFAPEAFIIAGYTGRDRAAVQRHIDELAAEGIPPPPAVPTYYPMPQELLTMEERIDVPGAQTCGEVEPVLLVDGDAVYLGVGSDHTARDLERIDIATSKRVCPKPLGATAVALDPRDLRSGALDELALESAIDGVAYQRGTFAAMRPLGEILDLVRKHAASGAKRFVVFCGTVPLLEHGFRFGASFEGVISGEALPAPLAVRYRVNVTDPQS